MSFDPGIPKFPEENAKNASMQNVTEKTKICGRMWGGKNRIFGTKLNREISGCCLVRKSAKKSELFRTFLWCQKKVLSHGKLRIHKPNDRIYEGVGARIRQRFLYFFTYYLDILGGNAFLT